DALLKLATEDNSAYVRMQAVLRLREKASLEKILPLLADTDPFISGAAIEVLGKPGNSAMLIRAQDKADTALRLSILIALRRTGEPKGRAALPKFLADPDPAIRRAAIQWVGEERLKDYAHLLNDAASKPPVTRELFEALLASNAF